MVRRSVAFILAAALSAGLLAQAPATPPAESQAAAQEDIIYGHQLMTETERMEYRARMRALKTAEERQTFRMEHHKMMQERARTRGITLPEMPPQRGMGQGMGMGKDKSMGPGRGQGMGQKRGANAPQTTPPPSAETEKPAVPK